MSARGRMEGDVYVGRPSMWGNPYRIGRDGNRAEVIERYRLWLADRPWLVEHLAALQPQRLTCWCAPLPCHGDVLAEALAAMSEKEGEID